MIVFFVVRRKVFLGQRLPRKPVTSSDFAHTVTLATICNHSYDPFKGPSFSPVRPLQCSEGRLTRCRYPCFVRGWDLGVRPGTLIPSSGWSVMLLLQRSRRRSCRGRRLCIPMLLGRETELRTMLSSSLQVGVLVDQIAPVQIWQHGEYVAFLGSVDVNVCRSVSTENCDTRSNFFHIAWGCSGCIWSTQLL